ncbi:reverse transcriptase family protein [Planctomycetota bacterium]
MGLWDRIKGLARLFLRVGELDMQELARRLDTSAGRLERIDPRYRAFKVSKRSGGTRRLLAPHRELKALQRVILHRLLRGLRSHPAVHGFERGRSIVTNALPHAGKAVVVRMDIQEFFTQTSAERVQRYFRKIGWSDGAARALTDLCTHEGGLPQGAPTSPRLSNLVNFRIDARLAGLARSLGATYTRYADDMTFSFVRETSGKKIARLLVRVRRILRSEGYTLHERKKLHVCRRHHRQAVTGLVVNERVQLPRETRRRLRAAEHRVRTGRRPTFSKDQLAGWRSLCSMIEKQRDHGS